MKPWLYKGFKSIINPYSSSVTLDLSDDSIFIYFSLCDDRAYSNS